MSTQRPIMSTRPGVAELRASWREASIVQGSWMVVRGHRGGWRKGGCPPRRRPSGLAFPAGELCNVHSTKGGGNTAALPAAALRAWRSPLGNWVTCREHRIGFAGAAMRGFWEVKGALRVPVGRSGLIVSVEGTLISARSWRPAGDRAGGKARWTLPREPQAENSTQHTGPVRVRYRNASLQQEPPTELRPNPNSLPKWAPLHLLATHDRSVASITHVEV